MVKTMRVEVVHLVCASPSLIEDETRGRFGFGEDIHVFVEEGVRLFELFRNVL